MIAFDDISTSALTEILDNAAMDWTISTSGSIYLQDGAVPCWISINSENQTMLFYTYWAFRSDKTELPILRLVNRANLAINMVQFSAPPDQDRFFGEYMFSIGEGLSPRLFLRGVRNFTEAFMIAVQRHDLDNVLADTVSGDSMDSGNTSMESHSLN